MPNLKFDKSTIPDLTDRVVLVTGGTQSFSECPLSSPSFLLGSAVNLQYVIPLKATDILRK